MGKPQKKLICSICGNEIEHPYRTSIFDGKEYSFCSEECQERFHEDPENYTQ